MQMIVAVALSAARMGDAETLMTTLKIDLNVVNYRGDDSNSLLFEAALKGMTTCVGFLLANDADVNLTRVEGHTAAFIAATNNHVECLKLLLKSGADPTTAIFAAALHGRLDCLKILLRSPGANPNAKMKGFKGYKGYPAMLAAAENNHTHCVQLLLEHGACGSLGRRNDGVTPLFAASAAGNHAMVKLLLSKGGELDVNCMINNLPITYMAAQNNHPKCLKLLLTHGAPPNVQSNAGTTFGVTSLFIAAQNCNVECVDVLLKHNADPNLLRTSDRATPLHMACQPPASMVLADDPLRSKCVQLLLKYGADPNISLANNGMPSCLHTAVRCGQFDIAHWLVVYEADITYRDEAGKTAADVGALRTTFNPNPFVLLGQWLLSVVGQPPLQIAAALQMHGAIVEMIQSGRVDPDNHVADFKAILVGANHKKTEQIVRDVFSGWSRSRHGLYHKGAQRAVHTVLAIANRLSSSGDAPLLAYLAPELWFYIIGFFCRSWWRP
jgi:ankyrin repeat protein